MEFLEKKIVSNKQKYFSISTNVIKVNLVFDAKLEGARAGMFWPDKIFTTAESR